MTPPRLKSRLRINPNVRRINSQVASTIIIVIVCVLAAMMVTWLVPSLSAASLNMLFRFRGRLEPPEDIVIVAIDDASLQRVGNWPWPRNVMATALDRITEAKPKAVGLDVIYAEMSREADDKLLTEAIRHNGRVSLPAQLTETESAQADSARGSSSWLLPLPEIKGAAAAVGHAHADPDVDGVLRTVQLSKASESGERLWAFGLETLRVAEGIPPEGIEEREDSLRLGRYKVAIHDEAGKSALPNVTIIRPNEMLINYLGPPGTFHYYSIGDVLDGRVPASTFRDKIVLIGAVAQTMGDTRITPFISYSGSDRQSGMGMPGVEVHANVIETVRRGAWLSPRSDWPGFILTLLLIIVATIIIRVLDGWRVIVLLSALLCLILFGSLYAFNHYFVIPPLVPMLTGFFMVVPLLLLHGSISASRDLDEKLYRLARIQKRFMLKGDGQSPELNARKLPVSLPRNLSWKLRAVDEITAHLVARVGFMNQVFTSMTEGLLVADINGRVIFANPAAHRFWNSLEADDVTGRSLTELFTERGIIESEALRETMRAVMAGRNVLRDVETSASGEGRFYTLQFSPVVASPNQAIELQPEPSATSDEESPKTIGLIVILTDVTKRRELDRIKAETLQLVSHELRAPLTSIRGLSETLLKFPVPKETSPELLETIYSEAVRLSELINSYLDVTRIESGTHLMERERVSVKNLINDCVRRVGQSAAEKRIQIKVNAQEPCPTLHCDPQLMAQAVSNLLINAIKYSPADSPVEIGCSSDDAHIRIYVRDYGYGIPAEFQARVFEKFFRLERDMKSEVVGTGLGLALVKEIVERHHGQVTLESETAKGSTFTIQLPLKQNSGLRIQESE